MKNDELLKSLRGDFSLEYNEKALLLGLLLLVCQTKVNTDHIIDELYPTKKKRNKIIDELFDRAMKLYHECRLIAASAYESPDGPSTPSAPTQ